MGVERFTDTNSSNVRISFNPHVVHRPAIWISRDIRHVVWFRPLSDSSDAGNIDTGRGSEDRGHVEAALEMGMSPYLFDSSKAQPRCSLRLVRLRISKALREAEEYWLQSCSQDRLADTTLKAHGVGPR